MEKHGDTAIDDFKTLVKNYANLENGKELFVLREWVKKVANIKMSDGLDSFWLEEIIQDAKIILASDLFEVISNDKCGEENKPDA